MFDKFELVKDLISKLKEVGLDIGYKELKVTGDDTSETLTVGWTRDQNSKEDIYRVTLVVKEK